MYHLPHMANSGPTQIPKPAITARKTETATS